LPASDPSKMNFGSGGNMDAKAWRDIWGCGQGIGVIHDVPSVAELVERLAGELGSARRALEEKLQRAVEAAP
jgi:nitronate monooxygenase